MCCGKMKVFCSLFVTINHTPHKSNVMVILFMGLCFVMRVGERFGESKGGGEMRLFSCNNDVEVFFSEVVL